MFSGGFGADVDIADLVSQLAEDRSQKRTDLFRCAFDDQFDPTVRQIMHETGDAKTRRQISRRWRNPIPCTLPE